jgi:hypothetical protein
VVILGVIKVMVMVRVIRVMRVIRVVVRIPVRRQGILF